MKAVAVVLQVLAEVVGIVAQAEDACAARHVGSRHDAVAGAQRAPLAVRDRVGAAYGLDHAHVLVAADERIGDVPFVVGARVLL